MPICANCFRNAALPVEKVAGPSNTEKRIKRVKNFFKATWMHLNKFKTILPRFSKKTTLERQTVIQGNHFDNSLSSQIEKLEKNIQTLKQEIEKLQTLADKLDPSFQRVVVKGENSILKPVLDAYTPLTANHAPIFPE